MEDITLKDLLDTAKRIDEKKAKEAKKTKKEYKEAKKWVKRMYGIK